MAGHRQLRRSDLADLRIQLGTASGGCAQTALGLAGILRIDFQPDYDLPLASCAVAAVACVSHYGAF